MDILFITTVTRVTHNIQFRSLLYILVLFCYLSLLFFFNMKNNLLFPAGMYSLFLSFWLLNKVKWAELYGRRWRKMSKCIVLKKQTSVSWWPTWPHAHPTIPALQSLDPCRNGPWLYHQQTQSDRWMLTVPLWPCQCIAPLMSTRAHRARATFL